MTQTVTYQTDTSDMLIPHGAFRSAFSSAPSIIDAVRAGDAERAALVGSYLDNVLRFLDAHHGGEDAILWPNLAERCPDAGALLGRMETEHETIHRARERAGSLLADWVDSADTATARRLVDAIATLSAEIDVHFREEETEILPLASRYMSPDEWGRLPGHAMANFTGDKVWLVLGLVFEQMTPEQRAMTLQHLPPPAVEMWTTTGSAAFDELIRNLSVGAA